MEAIKIVAVGDGAVGKTCMYISYSTGAFPSEYVPTVFDNYVVNVTINGKPCSVGLWDTAGQEEYDRLRPLSYAGTSCFLVVYSITNRWSFNNLFKWISEFQHYCGANQKFVLVGNKLDLEHLRQVPTQEARDFADKYGVPFFEVSALTQQNLKVAFDEMIKLACRTGGAPRRPRKKPCCLCFAPPPKNEKPTDMHHDSIWCLEVSPPYLYSGGRDKKLWCWDIASGRCVAALEGHTGQIFQIIANDVYVFTCSSDGSIKRWYNLGYSGEMNHSDYANCMQIVGNTLFSGSNDKTVASWDKGTCARTRTYVGSSAAINTLQVVGDFIWTGCADGKIRVWKLNYPDLYDEFEGHTASVNQMLQCHGDGTVVVSGDAAGGLRVWNTTEPSLRHTLNPHNEAINYMCVSGKVLYTASRDRTARAYKPHVGQLLRVFQGHTATVRSCGAAHGLLVTGGTDKTIRCYKPDGTIKWAYDGHEDYINRIYVNSDSAYTASRDCTIRRWRLKDGKLLRVFANTRTRISNEWTPPFEIIVGLVMIFVEFVQLTAFAFSSGIPWWAKHPLIKIASPLQLNFSFIDWSAFFLPLYILSSIGIVLFEIAFAFSSRIVGSDDYALKKNLWYPSCFICWLMSTVCFIPAVRSIISALPCYDSVIPSSDITCWSGAHITLFILAFPLIAGYLPLSLRMSTVDGSLSRVAVYMWKDWSNDKPDTRRLHILSHRSLASNRMFLLINFFTTVASVFLGYAESDVSTSSSGDGTLSHKDWGLLLALVAVLIVSALSLSLSVLKSPPYYNIHINSMRLSLLLTVFWTNCCALATLIVNDTSSKVTSVVHVLGYPVVICIGIILMRIRAHFMEVKERKMNLMLYNSIGVPSRLFRLLPGHPNQLNDENYGAPPSGIAIIHCAACNVAVLRGLWDEHINSVKHHNHTHPMVSNISNAPLVPPGDGIQPPEVEFEMDEELKTWEKSGKRKLGVWEGSHWGKKAEQELAQWSATLQDDRNKMEEEAKYIAPQELS
ncbi:Rac1 protein [Pelomyxa schiedti]|nr:Rac1 protein [Pelomyxa schiedti]